MKRTGYVLFRSVVGIAAILAAAVPGRGADDFAATISENSTSPRYILVTIVNDKTHLRQTICTLSTYFMGAIHLQHHLPYTQEGEQKGREIALASKNREYRFSEPAALKNLQVRYTPQILADVRSQLKNTSTADMVKNFASGKSQRIYEKHKDFKTFAAYRDALAYVLLERGLKPGQADRTGGLYLARQECGVNVAPENDRLRSG